MQMAEIVPKDDLNLKAALPINIKYVTISVFLLVLINVMIVIHEPISHDMEMF